MAVHHTAAIGFGRAAQVYERGRPGYPEQMMRWLVDALGLQAGRTVVDVAAGTGKLTRALHRTGATVVAVEPVAQMLAALQTADAHAVHAVAATAQALPLTEASVDAITVAQAFHWFATEEALAEMNRVLRDDGRIALVWNRRPLDDPLHAAIEAVIGRYRKTTPALASGEWRAIIDRSPRVAIEATHDVDHVVDTDVDGLLDRVASVSFVAALPADRRADVAHRIGALATRFGPALRLRYRCEGYLLTPR